MSKLKYIAKPDTWFDANSEIELVGDMRNEGFNMAIFRGYRNGEPDEKLYSWDEVEILLLPHSSENEK